MSLPAPYGAARQGRLDMETSVAGGDSAGGTGGDPAAPPPPTGKACDFCRRPRSTKNPITAAIAAGKGCGYYLPWAREGGTQCSICRNVVNSKYKNVSLSELRESLKDDSRHIEWMDEVKTKEDEMNGLAPRSKRKKTDAVKVDLAHEAVIEGKLNLGVFWPAKIYEDTKKKKNQKPVNYVHNGIKMKGIILPQSEGCPIGCIELSEKSIDRLRMVDKLSDETATREEVKETMAAMQKKFKVEVHENKAKDGTQEGVVVKMSGAKRKADDQSYLDTLWDNPFGSSGASSSSSRGTRAEKGPKKEEERGDHAAAEAPVTAQKSGQATKAETQRQKELDTSQNVIDEATELLQAVATEDFFAIAVKKFTAVQTKVERRLQPKHLALYSDGYSTWESQGMKILDDLQALKAKFQALKPLLEAVHTQQGTDGQSVAVAVDNAVAAGVNLAPRILEVAISRDAARLLEAKKWDEWKDMMYKQVAEGGGVGGVAQLPADQRATLQKSLLLQGLLSLLRSSAGAETLKAVVGKEVTNVMDKKFEEEMTHLSMLIHIDHHGVDNALNARAHFQNPKLELHKALKLFPMGQALMRSVEEKSRQSVADRRLQSDIDAFGKSISDFQAPTELEVIDAEHRLPLEVLQSLRTFYEQLAGFKVQGSPELLERNKEVMEKAEGFLKAGRELIINHRKGCAFAVLEKCFIVVARDLVKDTALRGEDIQRWVDTVSKSFEVAETALQFDSKASGLDQFVQPASCKDIEKTFALAQAGLADLRASVPLLQLFAHGGKAVPLSDKTALGALAVLKDPPAMLLECPEFDRFKATLKTLVGQALVERFSVNLTKGAKRTANMLAALFVFNNDSLLQGTLTMSGMAAFDVFEWQHLEAQSRFLVSYLTCIAPVLDEGPKVVAVPMAEIELGKTVDVPIEMLLRFGEITKIFHEIGALHAAAQTGFNVQNLADLDDCVCKVSNVLQVLPSCSVYDANVAESIVKYLKTAVADTVKVITKNYNEHLDILSKTGMEQVGADVMKSTLATLDGDFNPDTDGAKLLGVCGSDAAKTLYNVYKDFRNMQTQEWPGIRNVLKRIFDEPELQKVLVDGDALGGTIESFEGVLGVVANLTAAQALFREPVSADAAVQQESAAKALAAMTESKPPLRPHAKLVGLLEARAGAS